MRVVVLGEVAPINEVIDNKIDAVDKKIDALKDDLLAAIAALDKSKGE